jgi:hypothetical protein
VLIVSLLRVGGAPIVVDAPPCEDWLAGVKMTGDGAANLGADAAVVLPRYLGEHFSVAGRDPHRNWPQFRV